ncbi:MAG: hypothetical protein GY828_02725 [Candidatus Gracilibacteria bacterium]|nr:hypothetical protein [Candidatus Gracilibacteria bacterium]
MLQKLLLSILILLVLFILSIFNAPELAGALSNMFGYPNLPKQVIEFKESFDTVVTDIPTKDEVLDTYNTTLSGAIELKGKVIDGIHTTKETVDTIRETLSGAEEKIENAKETYNKTVEFIDETGKKIEETKKIIEDTSKVIENVQGIGEDFSSGSNNDIEK